MENHFSVGAVLGTGFRIWFKNLIPFLVITTLIYAPLIIWGIASVQGPLDLDNIERLVRFERWSLVIAVFVNVLVGAALTYGVVMELQGQRASIGACIATGLARFFPVLGVAILSWLAMAGGLILLIVPGIIMYCMLYVSTQAAVLERPGVTGALRRSRELTRGYRLQIFGLLFLIGLMNFGVNKIIQAVVLPTPKGPEDLAAYFKALPTYEYAHLAIQIVLGSIGAVMAAVAYYFLRNEKEGTSAAELAAVFE